TNAKYAVDWALNIPRGWQKESRHLQRWEVRFLELLRVAVIALAIWMMARTERRIVIAGGVWFFIGVGPALPLFEHFLPYYLFMPVVGVSVAVGVLCDAFYPKLASYCPLAAAGFIAVPLTVLAAINVMGARRDAWDNRVLGRSSRLAENSMTDLKKAYPALQL